MEFHFEGETGADKEKGQAAETENAAVEIEKGAVETGLTIEEIQIAEILVKAKADTPKVTQMAKGVEIQKGGLAKKRKEACIAEIKDKGKEKVVESAKASKKQSQIDLYEELATKMQAELEKEEETQSTKDREIALEMAAKLNEEYQKSVKSVVVAKKVTKKASRQSLYGKVLEEAGMSLIKLAMEYLCMMFDPRKVQHVVRDLHLENKFQRIDNWMLFERCGVYVITIDKSYHEYYLVDRIYDHSKAKLQDKDGMIAWNKRIGVGDNAEDNYGLDSKE
ncbi:hypothetical protein L6452_35982 [Arctium lappa]|uniref:Uncharacterized protein n=1 Tax=Arctium lappa TaxID=4217 RepID=A0ACB8Y8G9_ARCLA|nr:hypothetical protein L6452_35982 [Arctium lappa]